MFTFPARLYQRLRQHKTLALVGIVLPSIVFGSLATGVWRTGRFIGDETVLTFLHRHATPGLDRLAIFLTIIGNTWPMMGTGLLALGLLLARGYRRLAWAFSLAVGGSMLLTQVVKAAVMRPRPSLWLSLHPEHTFSFPSGHAMDTAAVAAALCFLAWPYRGRWWVWALAPLFSLGVGWARMYLGVHYPSDVLAGWSAAVAWVVLVQLVWGVLPPQAVALENKSLE